MNYEDRREARNLTTAAILDFADEDAEVKFIEKPKKSKWDQGPEVLEDYLDEIKQAERGAEKSQTRSYGGMSGCHEYGDPHPGNKPWGNL